MYCGFTKKEQFLSGSDSLVKLMLVGSCLNFNLVNNGRIRMYYAYVCSYMYAYIKIVSAHTLYLMHGNIAPIFLFEAGYPVITANRGGVGKDEPVCCVRVKLVEHILTCIARIYLLRDRRPCTELFTKILPSG